MSLQATYLTRTTPPSLFLWEPPPAPGTPVPGGTSPLTYGRGELALLPLETRNLLKLTIQELELPERGTTALTGFLLPLPDGIGGLIAREEWHAGPVPLHPSLSFTVWSLSARLLLELLARQRIVPTLDETGTTRWRVILTAPEDRRRVDALAGALPPVAHVGSGLDTPDAAIRAFLDRTADAIARLPRQPTLPATRLRSDWEEPLFKALVGPFPRVRSSAVSPVTLSRILSAWARPVLERQGEEDWALSLSLDPPAVEGARWTLCFGLQPVGDPQTRYPLAELWARRPMGGRRPPPVDVVLTRLGEVGRMVPAVQASLKDPQPERAELTEDDAFRFVTETVPLLAGSAISVRVPEDLVRAGRQRLRARLVVGRRATTASLAPGTGALRMDELVEFSYEVALGDEVLTTDQFKQIVAAKRPLLKWRDRWIMIDPEDTERLEPILAKRTAGTLTGAEALRLALAGQSGRGHKAVEVVATDALAELIERLRTLKPDREPPAPPDFTGSLRPYQARGMAWMGLLTDLTLGALLADDMGLGKTVELIAWLLWRRDRLTGPVLLICPTSVLGNWQRELERFAPSIRVRRHHGPQRGRDADELAKLDPATVVITTYALVRRDADMLEKVGFGALVLDEAQALKNPQSMQAEAVRRLSAPCRIALTGTPIENHLTDLWSIMEVLNPGLLGGFRQFLHELALPIERYADEEASATLRRLTAPFVLRRVKTDPAVLSDLPEKNEMFVHCSLTTEQATLYQALLDQHLENIAESAGIARHGRVLALITKLKQVLNHPAHLLRQTGPLSGRSGKLERMEEMLSEVVSGEERALVFTQFREMGDLLAARLTEQLGVPIPFLHGGVPALERDRMVRRFQEDADAPPVFVLSLRAGGTGLNLTRANHVFHFDRWWNPAVEDQATDRAHRIGQTRSVQVHKLLTLGTLEEKIEKLLDSKRALASGAIGTGETWITELDDASLRDLLSLSDAVVVDEEGS